MKRIKIFPVFICIMFLLCGCDLKGGKNYQGTMEIPENGIVDVSIFKQIKDDSAVVTFKGNSNGCDYEWVIFGDDIPEPKTLNLAVEINEKQEERSSGLSFRSEDGFGFAPVLSVHLNSNWDCQNATVYDSGNKAVCGASVTGSENSIINFSVDNSVGEFIVRADNESENAPIIAETPTETKASPVSTETKNTKTDPYLTPVEPDTPNAVTGGGNRVISDGSATEQDKYKTDPVPEGRPMPVEPEDTQIDSSKTYTCTFSIECSTILNNLAELNPEKIDVLPADGIILPACEVQFYEGESVYDVLQRICKENNIHMEASWTPIYNSAYVEGINNLYEFDCGSLSGWMYRVNGWYPNYGCSRYQLTDGETVEWRYTCDLGNDVGGGYAVSGT